MKKRRGVSIKTFVADNQLLLLFLSLMLVGTTVGSMLYGNTDLSLTAGAILPTWEHMSHAWVLSMMMPVTLLGLLFLAGLTVFGVPITVAISLFFGLGIGFTQGCYYAQGINGMWISCLVVLPRFAVAATAVLMACAESFRMSVRFCRLVFPGGSVGNLWVPFRLYLMRFLLFVGITAISAGIDVIVRTVCADWL